MTRYLLLLFSIVGWSSAVAQDFTVRGQVTSAQNSESLPGVNVAVKGTTRGTITDIDGNYQVSVPSASDTLIFSFIGYVPLEVAIGNQSSLNVELREDVQELGEVVVTGFQEVERKLFTGAAEMVEMENIRQPGMVDASRMLEGQVAGVSVDNVSGTFGTAPRIRIRGNTSINGDNQPLYVVDGVILEDLTQVDADDIVTGDFFVHRGYQPGRYCLLSGTARCFGHRPLRYPRQKRSNCHYHQTRKKRPTSGQLRRKL